MSSDNYPDNNPKTALGIKKPPLDAIPPIAIMHLGIAMEAGKQKYGLYNYREKSVSASVYYNAMLRHLFEWKDGGDYSSDTNPPAHHLGHVMACAAILLDAESLGQLNDDRNRGFHGKSTEFIQEFFDQHSQTKKPQSE